MFVATVVKLIFFFIKEILICMIEMSAQINAWITEEKCHLPSPENRTNKQAARSSSKLGPAPSGIRSIILRSCNRLQVSNKARKLSRATAQMLGVFALAPLNHLGREIYSLIKPECLHCGLEGTKNPLPWKWANCVQSRRTPLLLLGKSKAQPWLLQRGWSSSTLPVITNEQYLLFTFKLHSSTC